MKIMQEEGLVCLQRRSSYKMTTKPRPGAEVTPNLLNQNFNSPGSYQVWVRDITHLKTGEGWLYLAAIRDLYSRRIVGWHVDKRMTTSLVCRALMKAYNLRNPAWGLVVNTLSIPVNASRHSWIVTDSEAVWEAWVPAGIMR